MPKVVINACFGGFGLSREAIDEYAKEKGLSVGKWNETWGFYEVHEGSEFHDRDIPRDDPILVSIVERLGEKAGGRCAELKIVEIPDGVDWQVEEYDGSEWVSEKHRTWQ